MLSSPPRPLECTKGGDHDPIVSVDGTVSTMLLHVTTATLHTKQFNGSRALDRTVGGHHSIHDGHIKLVDAGHESRTRGLRCSCNREWRGSPMMDSLVWCTADLMISGRLGTPTTREDPQSPTRVTENPNPNSSISSSPPPRLSWVIWLPSSTRTQQAAGHLGVITDAHPLDSTVRRDRFHL
jgi:hypothetical protein